MSIFSGIRWGVGTDFWTYKGIFEGILKGAPEDIEPLFYWLNVVIRSITADAQVFFIITSIIINTLIILVLYKRSSDFKFSLFLYVSMGFYLTSFNILRQFIAMAIMFYVINYKQKIRKLNIIIAVIIAMGFHNTSIVMLGLLLFKENIELRKTIIIIGIISIFAYIFEPIITNFVLSGKYEDYGESIFFSYGTSMLYVIEYIGLLIFYYIYDNRITEKNKFYLMVVSCGVIFTMLGLKGVLYNRISIGFNLYNTLLLPNILASIDNKKEKRLLKYSFYVIYSIKFILILKTAQVYNTNFSLFYLSC